MKEIIITSSVLILVVLLLRRLLRGKISLRLQYALWALVLLRLLLPVFPIESPVSLMNAAAPMANTAARVLGRMGYTPSGSTLAQLDIHAVFAEQQAPSGANQTKTSPGQAETPITLTRVLPGLWLAGAGAVGLCLLFANLSFSRKLRKTREKFPADNCQLPVYTVAALPSPCLAGLFRPAIYITPQVAADATQRRHVLAHELTHYRQGDHIWSALRGLSLALHWYNPLVWLAAALSRRDGELACDEATVSTLGETERLDYGRTLIRLTSGKPSAMDLLCCATTMTDGKKGIKERVQLIAKKPKMAAYTLIGVLALAGLALALTFTGAVKTAAVDGGAYTLELPARFDYAFFTPSGGGKATFTLRGETVGGVDLYLYAGPRELEELHDFLRDQGLFQESVTSGRDSPAASAADFDFSIKPDAGGESRHYIFFTSTAVIYDLWFDSGKFRRGEQERVCRSFTLTENSGIVPLTAAEVAQYNKTFEPILHDGQGHSSVNPLSHFLRTYYDRPENLNLSEFLRYFPSEDVVTDEAEFQALKAAANWPFGADMTLERMPVPIHKFPAATVDGALKTYLGIALGDLSGVGLDQLLYLETYDAYYNFTSDFMAGTFNCVSGERQGDNIRLFGENVTLTLKKQGDGFLFVSHQRLGAETGSDNDSGSGSGNDSGFPAAGGMVMAGVDVPEKVLAAAKAWVAEVFTWERSYQPNAAYSNWRIQSLQWAYSYGDLEGLALDIYRLNYEFLAAAPEQVQLAGGMYMTEDNWVCPTYPDCTYLVFEAGSEEFLFAIMENDCEPGDETFTVDLTHTLLSQQYDSDAGTVLAFVDINRDGQEETLYLDKSRMDSEGLVTLRVYDSDGKEIWSEDAGTPHAGWNSLFLTNLEGQDYLLRYNPGMWQGRGSYTYTLFTLEGGAEKVYQTDTLEFDINGAQPLDPERMAAFADAVNALLQRSMLLVSSEGGVFAFGPASAEPFWETYSWLENYPQAYAKGDDLATRLKKYSDYAIANRVPVD